MIDVTSQGVMCGTHRMIRRGVYHTEEQLLIPPNTGGPFLPSITYLCNIALFGSNTTFLLVIYLIIFLFCCSTITTRITHHSHTYRLVSHTHLKSCNIRPPVFDMQSLAKCDHKIEGPQVAGA